MKNSNNKTRLEALEAQRKEYTHVRWKSSGGASTRIVNVDDNYLRNIMRSVSKSLVLASHYPLVDEFQSYESVKYTDWQRYLQNEYLYRDALVEKRYNDFSDMRDYGAAGNIY